MATFYTILLIAAILFGIDLAVKHVPKKSGNLFPDWVCNLPSSVLTVAGVLSILGGFAMICILGHMLFGQGLLGEDSKSYDWYYWTSTGIACSVLIFMCGFSFIGIVGIRKEAAQRASANNG